jgi:hypothetical protein
MNRTWSVMVVVFALTTLVGASSGDCGGGASSAATAAARSASSGSSSSSSGSGDGSGPSSTAFKASLRGFEEVPAISTTGTGRFEAVLAADGLSLAWTLEYAALDALVAAMRSGVTYVNVHTTRFASGEIRGQLKKQHGDDHGDDDD